MAVVEVPSNTIDTYICASSLIFHRGNRSRLLEFGANECGSWLFATLFSTRSRMS